MHKQLRSDYFEAIIQIRPKKMEVIQFIKNQILKRNDVFIAKEEQLKTGVDFYGSSQKFVKALGKKLKSTFKGEVTMSYTLHTRDRQTSKDKYRATLLFRAEEDI